MSQAMDDFDIGRLDDVIHWRLRLAGRAAFIRYLDAMSRLVDQGWG